MAVQNAEKWGGLGWLGAFKVMGNDIIR